MNKKTNPQTAFGVFQKAIGEIELEVELASMKLDGKKIKEGEV